MLSSFQVVFMSCGQMHFNCKVKVWSECWARKKMTSENFISCFEWQVELLPPSELKKETCCAGATHFFLIYTESIFHLSKGSGMRKCKMTLARLAKISRTNKVTKKKYFFKLFSQVDLSNLKSKLSLENESNKISIPSWSLLI